MIRPVSYNNATFAGHLAIKVKEGRKERNIDDIIAHIPGEEERAIFKKELDTFQKNLEDETSDEANYVLELGYDHWYAGNSMRYGNGISFNLQYTEDINGSVYNNTYPIERPKGEGLWAKGQRFQHDLQSFLWNMKAMAVRKRNTKEALERAHSRKN